MEAESRLERLRRWQSVCECVATSYQDCQCGAAQRCHLVCQVCGADLVARRPGHPHTKPFWGCQNFPSQQCRYTQNMADADVQEFIAANSGPATVNGTSPGPSTSVTMDTPPRNETTNLRQHQNHQERSRPHSVTPEHLSNTNAESTARRNLGFAESTATSRRLQDTFIGVDHAKALITQHAFSPTVKIGYPNPHHHNRTHDGPSRPRLFYYEDWDPRHRTSGDPRHRTSGLLYCYWFDEWSPGLVAQPVLGRKPTVLDLFAGAGGMSHGLLQAGFEVPVAVEWDKTAADTLRWNHRDTIVYQEPIQSFLEGIRNGTANYPNIRFDHIHASPPCQGFSEANRRPMPHHGERNELTNQLIEAVRLIRPTTVSMENVRGILNQDHDHYLQWVAAELLKLDYQVQISLVNAKHYGVPQHRLRLILLAAKRGFPLPQSPAMLQHHPSVSVDEALGDLESINPVSHGVPVTCETGHVVYDHIEWRPSYMNGEQRLERGEPAPTLCRRNILRHYRHNRDLTLRERARLQSFPDHYCFCGNPEEQADQIGNAVPVRLAHAIGCSIMEAYRAYYG